MSKRAIMELTNKLLWELEWADDEEFIDRVVDAVRYNDPFTDEDIYEMEDEEDED